MFLVPIPYNLNFQHCRLAKKFESLVRKDTRFEVMGKVHMGLVCIRLKVHVRLHITLTSDLLL